MKSMKRVASIQSLNERFVALKAFGNDFYTLQWQMHIGKMLVEIEMQTLKRLNEV